ncbi:hypothetical protein EZV62_018855 [Acer yangbiense]|uniref:CCHC-type domain-containing protein n=1 Tax=Acer yangbiense TaxID=1000413 RepID=A0A5C7HA01_9ROSI|nr:hypothetical protein EZV62_018855 [Acer yangbiense]
MLMENFLHSKEYWSLVENGIPAVAEGVVLTDEQKKAIDEQKLKDLKAKNYLFQAIDRSILETILHKDTAKDIWDSLKQKYQGTTRVKRAQLQALRKEFEVLHIKVRESVNEYFSRTLTTLTIANKMRIHGEKMGDIVVIEKILRSMIPKFDYVVCSIEESNHLDVLSIDELQSSLLVHEQRMNCHIVEEQALKNFDKSTVECYYCHDLGHFQYECPKKETKTNYVEASEEMLLMAYVEDVKEVSKEELWFLDSGCSNYMCGKKELFSVFDGGFREFVKLGNNSSMDVMGKGNVQLQVNGIMQQKKMVHGLPQLTASSIVCENCLVGKQQRDPFPKKSTWRASQIL